MLIKKMLRGIVDIGAPVVGIKQDYRRGMLSKRSYLFFSLVSSRFVS
jgi:hypothetical protein